MRHVNCFVLCGCLLNGLLLNGGPIFAQLGTVDPYQRDPQSTLSTWPVFYKLPPGHKLQYYLMGWCGNAGRGKTYDRWYQENCTFNVNALPETSMHGKVTKIADALLTAADEKGQTFSVVVYPDLAVTDAHVVGVATPDQLKRDLWVHFVGRANAKHEIDEPVTQLEIYSPRKTDHYPRVSTGELQTIAGRLIRETAHVWQLKPASQGQFNLVGFSLAKDVQLTFDSASLSLVQPGDAIEVRGRLFDEAAQAEAAQPKYGFFADKLSGEPPPADTKRLPIIYACELRARVSNRMAATGATVKSQSSYSGHAAPLKAGE